MPLPIMLAHKLVRGLSNLRRDGTLKYLRPDGKSQVTVDYEGTTPVRVDAVVVSSQHSPDVSQEQMRDDVVEKIVKCTIPASMMDKDTNIYVNPTGRFVVGGPHGDAGVTGRKIIVDTYGGAAPHGGGAFSGKDPTKVDRSACYMARYIAKNVVAAGLADRALVQLAYAIGVADPVSVMVHTEGTGNIPEEQITDLVRAHFKLTPRGIGEELDLRRPIYKKTAAFGHFGRTEQEFTWERTDKAAALGTVGMNVQDPGYRTIVDAGGERGVTWRQADGHQNDNGGREGRRCFLHPAHCRKHWSAGRCLTDRAASWDAVTIRDPRRS
jgi:S-adenosylmethionine synthetase